VGTDVIFGIAAGAIGLCLGSFLNVCILRLPHDQSLVTPPSTCPRCGKRIAWYDNIPVLSWLVLRAKCRTCGEPISLQYPLIEALVGALWVGAYLLWGVSVHTIAGGILGTILLGIGITDARHYLIPDEYNWAGLAVGLAASLVGGWQGFVQAVIGAAFGFSLLFAVGVAGRWMFGEEAMGGGTESSACCSPSSPARSSGPSSSCRCRSEKSVSCHSVYSSPWVPLSPTSGATSSSTGTGDS
jgi:leader peptidase (prepilin peptidase)/N-methyltransferase